MKIMIIGATGMAGSAITKLALERGHDVIAIGRSEEKLANLPSMRTWRLAQRTPSV